MRPRVHDTLYKCESIREQNSHNSLELFVHPKREGTRCVQKYQLLLSGVCARLFNLRFHEVGDTLITFPFWRFGEVR